MKLKLLIQKIFHSFGLDIRRANKNQKSPLSFDEVKEINNNTLTYISSLSGEEIYSRIQSISHHEPLDKISEEKIKTILDKEGIVVIPGVLDEPNINETSHFIKKILNSIKKDDPDGLGYETDDYIVSGKKKIGDSYYDLSNHEKSVINIRQGSDQGMIDIFNVDRLLGKSGYIIRKIFFKDWLINLLHKFNKPINPKNLNLYINHSITKTRGFHIDSNYRSIKGFVYLSDVNSLEDGPYCYVRGTHIDTLFKKVNNSVIGLKEAPFVNPLKIVPVLGKKGTLILSDQSGIHRGIPQKQGSVRELLVMRYA